MVQTPSKPFVDFTSLPILDYSLACSPETRPQFILQLRHALINVGFFYLKNHPIPPALFDSLTKDYVPRLFAVPQHEKDKIDMTKSECFLGYLRVGKEITHDKYDWREQFDFASPPVHNYTEGVSPKEYEYMRYLGASQVSLPLPHFLSTSLKPIYHSGWTKQSSQASALFSRNALNKSTGSPCHSALCLQKLSASSLMH